MNGSTALFDFIDGALDPVGEQTLFDELARHPELRAELRHYIAIGEAVRADREAYVPPSEVEHALMSGLGIAPIAGFGGAAAAGAASRGVLGRFTGFKGMGALVGSFVTGVIVATGGFFAAYTGGQIATTGTIRDTIVVREMPTTAAAPALTSPEPSAAAPSTERSSFEPAARRAEPTNVRSSAVVVDRADDLVDTPPLVAEEQHALMGRLAEPVDLRLADHRGAPVIALDDAAEATTIRGPDQKPETFAAIMATRDQGPAFAEYRAISVLRPFVDNNASKVESGPTDEWSAGAYGRLSETFSLGLEVGQGRYPQVLVYPETYTSDGRPIGREIARIEQDPNVLWAGVSARQELGTLNERMPFWVQGTVGYGFGQGPVVNTRAGLSLDVASRVSLNGAVETTSLVYFFNGQPLLSAKYGFSIGIQAGL